MGFAVSVFEGCSSGSPTVPIPPADTFERGRRNKILPFREFFVFLHRRLAAEAPREQRVRRWATGHIKKRRVIAFYIF